MTAAVTATILVVVLALVAAAIDLRRGRIPNVLTLPAIAAGLALAAMDGWRIFGLRALAVTVLLAAGMLAFAAGAAGGGDGKLAAAIAALMGFRFTVEMLLTTLLIGGVVAAFVLWRKGTLKPAVLGAVGHVLIGRPLQPPAESSRIRLAPILAIAVLITIAASRAGVHWSALLC